MTEFDDVFDALQPLSGPPADHEETGLVAALDAMVATFTTVTEHRMNPTSSRRKTIATLLVTGVIGFGGVAAAGPGGFDVLDSSPSTSVAPPDLESTTTVVSSTTVAPTTTVEATTTTIAPSTTVAPSSTVAPTTTIEVVDESDDDSAAAPLEDDPDTVFDETLCADGNHGKTVSSVAKATEGPNKGQTVRDAAHSSCGKQSDKTDDDDDDDDRDDDLDDHDDADDDDDADHDDDADDDDDDDADDDANDGSDEEPKSKGNSQRSNDDRGKSGNDKSGNGNGKSGNGKTKGK